MRYTNEDFVNLLEAVELQNGTLLDGVCKGHEIKYEKPKPETVYSSGCGQEGRMEIPYNANEDVLVPEPILEDDPVRDPWTDPLTENERHTQRSVKTKDKDGKDQVAIAIVERKGDFEGAGIYQTIDVCAFDDNVGMWPRFRHAIEDERSG